MERSILVRLLKKMSPKLLENFQEYVDSPFFNKNKKVKLLGKAILESIKKDDFSDKSKTELYILIYGNIPFDEFRINNLISDLLQLLYQFLGQLTYQNHPTLQQQFTIDALQNQGLYPEAERPLRKAQTLESKSPFRNFNFYHQKYQRLEQLDKFLLTEKQKSDSSTLQEKSDTFDLYFMTNKLRIACDMVSRSRVSKSTFHPDFLTEIVQRYNNNSTFQTNPALQIYYEVLQMFEYPDQPDFYHRVKNTLSQDYHFFPQEELRVIYVYLINYCAEKINKGKSNYYREIQDLFKILLLKKIILQNGYLTEQSFKNIITVGIRLKDFEWTESVIEEYKNSIDPKKRDNAVAYNLANLYYARKDYAAALQQLHNVVFTDKAYHISTKIIQIKSYFELNETEALYALITAFRKFITRNKKMPEYHRLTNNNFLRFTKKIYQLQNSRKRKSKKAFQKEWDALKAALEQETAVANKAWLLEKVS